MTVGFVIFLIVGRLLIALGNKFASQIKTPFLNNLFSCSLCLGFWVYGILAWPMGQHIFLPYFPVISEVVTGAVATYLVFYLEQGWKAVHEVIVI